MNSSGYKVNLLENQTYVVEDEKKTFLFLVFTVIDYG